MCKVTFTMAKKQAIRHDRYNKIAQLTHAVKVVSMRLFQVALIRLSRARYSSNNSFYLADRELDHRCARSLSARARGKEPSGEKSIVPTERRFPDQTDTVDFPHPVKIARGNSGNPFLVRQIAPRCRLESRTAAYRSSFRPRRSGHVCQHSIHSSAIRGPGFN